MAAGFCMILAETLQFRFFDGKLALITNTTDISPAEAVVRYKGLADIERGFRVLKSDIEIARFTIACLIASAPMRSSASWT